MDPMDRGGFRGQRRLESYSPWDSKESDTTEATEHAHSVLSDKNPDIISILQEDDIDLKS